MKTLLLTLALVITVSGLLACVAGPTDTIPPVSAAGLLPSKKTMRAFTSEQELRRYFRELAEKQKRATRREANGPGAADMAAASPVAKAEAPAKEEADSEESVTNTQHAGVDEGGIVKVHGDHLVVLRRGRLFTVKIGDGALKPVSAVDAFGPDIDPQSTWYDEMLISGDKVIVIGYSYERGGTEIGMFDIDREGHLE